MELLQNGCNMSILSMATKNTNKKMGGNLLTLSLRAKDNKFSFFLVELQFTKRHPSLHIM